MGWMRSDRIFGARTKVFVVSHRDNVFQELHFLGGLLDCDPVELCKRIEGVIARERPELAGGVVEAMQFEIASRSFRILYSHVSFPPVQFGAECDYEPLIRGGK